MEPHQDPLKCHTLCVHHVSSRLDLKTHGAHVRWAKWKTKLKGSDRNAWKWINPDRRETISPFYELLLASFCYNRIYLFLVCGFKENEHVTIVVFFFVTADNINKFLRWEVFWQGSIVFVFRHMRHQFGRVFYCYCNPNMATRK